MLPEPAPLFRELRGDYVDGAGQRTTLREYLDYFEPLGTALSRLPDGAGGPFLYQFTGSGGDVIGAMGWVVNASAKRFGAWTLWGMWADRPVPPLALPFLWQELSDSRRLPELLARANANAERLLDGDVFDDIDTRRLHDARFRALLKTHLSRAYRAGGSRDRPIEVEVTGATLDLLPWLYLLGPVDPEIAQVQPNRFNGIGYQYILVTGAAHAEEDEPIAAEIDAIVDTAANDLLQGWKMAVALRERRSARRVAEPAPRHRTSSEISDMRTPPAPSKRSTPPPARAGDFHAIWRIARDVVIIALLAWIGWNLHAIRKRSEQPAATVQTTTAAAMPTESAAEPPPPTRAEQIADALAANPPRGVQIAPAVLETIRRDDAASSAALGRVAVEIFLRRNGCLTRPDAVDGRFSTAEQRAIRSCTALTRERLMAADLQPHPQRAVEWLEGVLAPR